MDYYKDSGHLFAKLFYQQDLPDFVKAGAIETSDSLKKLGSHAFADPARREYPIHDRGHVYISAAYASVNGGDAPIEAIKKAAELFGISKEVEDLIARIDQKVAGDNQKTASAVEEPISFSIPFGPFHKLEGSSKLSLAKVADVIQDRILTLPFETRTLVAQDFSKLANEHGVEVPFEIQCYAGAVGCDVQKLANEQWLRASLLVDSRQKQEIGFIQKSASFGESEFKVSEPESCMKMAALINEFDLKHGLDRFYGERISDPHKAVFNIDAPRLTKEASDSVVRIGVREYGRDRWEGGNFNMWQEALEHALGKSKAAEINEGGRPDAQKLASLSDLEADRANRFLSAIR